MREKLGGQTGETEEEERGLLLRVGGERGEGRGNGRPSGVDRRGGEGRREGLAPPSQL